MQFARANENVFAFDKENANAKAPTNLKQTKQPLKHSSTKQNNRTFGSVIKDTNAIVRVKKKL